MNEIAAIRSVVERDTARRLCLQVMKEARELPEAGREEAATTKLHKLLLAEMLDYKDRLNAACKAVLQEALKEVCAAVQDSGTLDPDYDYPTYEGR